MSEEVQFRFADNVKVAATPETEALGLANRTGQVFGSTMPSSTGVSFVGSTLRDCAIAVKFEDLPDSVWFAPELLELVDHAQGTTVTIGTKKFKKNSDGVWMKDE